VSRPAPFADVLSRFVFERAAVRGALVSLDATCREILACHPYPPALARVLAELLAAAALLASTLKFKGALVVQLQGGGPVRLLVVECGANLDLRAIAQWDPAVEQLPPDAPLAALAGDLATARLAITLDPKDGGPMYQGIVALAAGSIASLVEHYLATSEQIDSRMALAAEGRRVRGMLLQRLPEAGAQDEESWRRAAARLEALAPAELLEAADAEPLLRSCFDADDVRLFTPREARFRCGCSEARVANALRMLGRTEIESILAEQGLIGVTCEFCNRRYTFVAADARALFAAPSSPVPPPSSGGVRH
jgi:molecular chaperone Hsp33